jgi:hypothetical protein
MRRVVLLVIVLARSCSSSRSGADPRAGRGRGAPARPAARASIEGERGGSWLAHRRVASRASRSTEGDAVAAATCWPSSTARSRTGAGSPRRTRASPPPRRSSRPPARRSRSRLARERAASSVGPSLRGQRRLWPRPTRRRRSASESARGSMGEYVSDQLAATRSTDTVTTRSRWREAAAVSSRRDSRSTLGGRRPDRPRRGERSRRRGGRRCGARRARGGAHGGRRVRRPSRPAQASWSRCSTRAVSWWRPARRWRCCRTSRW